MFVCVLVFQIRQVMTDFYTSDALRDFPPKTVQLKRPFGVHPWIESEERVGNLLMVS